MAIHKWADLKKEKLTPARRAKLDAEVARELLELDLAAIRELLGLTQEELGRALKVRQAQVSKMEAREDHKVSTLRRYVAALGGELEIRAVFGDRTVKLHSAA